MKRGCSNVACFASLQIFCQLKSSSFRAARDSQVRSSRLPGQAPWLSQDPFHTTRSELAVNGVALRLYGRAIGQDEQLRVRLRLQRSGSTQGEGAADSRAAYDHRCLLHLLLHSSHGLEHVQAPRAKASKAAVLDDDSDCSENYAPAQPVSTCDGLLLRANWTAPSLQRL